MGKKIAVLLGMLVLLGLAARFGYEVSETKHRPDPTPEPVNEAWRDPFWMAAYTEEEWTVVSGLECPEGMALIPRGTVDSIWLPRSSYSEYQPGEKRPVAAYCMDRFEYPNRRYELPRVAVSWTEAERLCREAGKRLCAEDEWERACTMGRGWRFSYGPKYIPHRCNTEQEVGAKQAIAPVGSRFECRNRYSVFDLNGNVSEWVDSHSDQPNGGVGIVRGGTAWRGAEYGGDCYSRHAHPVEDTQWEDDGFRCCADSRPK
jgi:eukaryotic-like serine/threonine-protein kinase